LHVDLLGRRCGVQRESVAVLRRVQEPHSRRVRDLRPLPFGRRARRGVRRRRSLLSRPCLSDLRERLRPVLHVSVRSARNLCHVVVVNRSWHVESRRHGSRDRRGHEHGAAVRALPANGALHRRLLLSKGLHRRVHHRGRAIPRQPGRARSRGGVGRRHQHRRSRHAVPLRRVRASDLPPHRRQGRFHRARLGNALAHHRLGQAHHLRRRPQSAHRGDLPSSHPRPLSP
jgi:hypothetical protein